MINDKRDFKIDDFNDIVFINAKGKEEDIVIADTVKFISTYIKEYKIATVGVTIVHNNARKRLSKPSGKGTMHNLYTLFALHYNENEDQR